MNSSAVIQVEGRFSDLVPTRAQTERDDAAPWMQPLGESERWAEHFDVLSVLSDCFSASTLDEVATGLTRVLRLTFGFDVLDVTVFKERTEDVLWRAQEMEPGSPRDIPTEEAVRWAYQHQRVLWSDQQDRDGRSFTREGWLLQLRTDGRFFCTLPLSTPQRRLGALFVSGPQVGRYSADDVRLLTRIADHVSVAFDNVLSRVALRHEQDRVDLLLQLSTTIASTLEFPELLRVVSISVRGAMRCHGVGVILPEPATKQLRLYAIDDAGRGYTVLEGTSVSRSAPDAAFRTGEPLVVNGLEAAVFTSDAAHRLLTDQGVKALCDLPLISRGRVVGVLELSSQDEDAFGPDDVKFLMRAAGQIAIAVENALAYGEIRKLKEALAQEKVYLEDEIRHELNFEEIIGRSAVLRRVLQQVERVAPTDATVLIYGETGTGKELIARAIHNLSGRQSHTFVKLNCAAIPTGLLESELFGHERGAFTGAIAQRVGRFELAHQGTVFLDEVGEIPLELQTKLLRVLQEREFERLGSARTIRTDARLIAASNRDLAAMVEAQSFRADLFYRLNVFPIHVPALRERAEDIPLLVRHFVQQFAQRMNRSIETIPSDTMEALVRYEWPGNIREMQNLIERAVILSTDPVLRVPLADLSTRTSGSNGGRRQTLAEAERAHIVAVLKESQWVLSGPRGAARHLGMNRSTLQFRMKKLGIVRPPLAS
jgi:formate hydrogenlyase transcriptional activator